MGAPRVRSVQTPSERFLARQLSELDMAREYALLLLLLAILLARAYANPAPTHVSQHFEIYDYAGAGSEYATAVAAALEEAFGSFVARGVTLAPPCSDSRYAVNVVQLASGEGGFVRQQFTIRDGLVKEACIAWVNISKGLDAQLLEHVAHHEVAHIAQAAYYRYEAVVQAYPWYIEASAEGLAGALTGICGWEPYYFSYKLYGYNPYSFSGAATQCYALSAFYHWAVMGGYATAHQALSGSLSGASAFSEWVNEAYVSFLIALARGLNLCGSRYTPSYTDVHLPKGSWNADLKLEGLSAAYYRISIPGPGPILITAPSGLRSNLLLNKPFKTENTTLLLALVNPSLNPVSGSVAVTYTPPFEVSVASGVFDPESGRLELELRLLYASKPVEGTVYVNGTPVEAVSGYARAALSIAGWGSYSIAVQYFGETAYTTVRVAQPSAELETATPLYLSSSGRGELVVRIRNTGDVTVKLLVSAAAPPFLQVASAWAEAPPGDSRLSLAFRAIGPVEHAGCALQLRFGASSISLPFNVQPSNLTMVEASYDSESNATIVTASADPPGLRLTARVLGLSGEAWFKLSTYYVGCINVALPRPTINLSAKPLLVAPSWLLLAVNATVRASGCPDYPVSYRVVVAVNGTVIGAASLRCEGSALLSAVINATYGPQARVTLAEKSGLLLEVPVPLPNIEVTAVDWLLTDEGSVVKAKISVEGPCKYVVLGREVANDTLELEDRLEVGAIELAVDTGFKQLSLRMPPVSLELVAPRVAAATAPLKLALALRSQARVNASFELLLNGEVAATLRLSNEAGGEAFYDLEVQPPRPALYNVTARAWFASASTSVAYVLAHSLELKAPSFMLLNRTAEFLVDLRSEPPLKLPVNITVTGCEHASIQLEANSSFGLSSTKPCTAYVSASFLNLTAYAVTRWDALSVAPERFFGLLHGGFVVPNGTVTFTAYFSNGSRAPAEVSVEGGISFSAEKLGGFLIRVRAEYMGQANETTVAVFVVPEGLYKRSLSTLARIGEAPNLKAAIEAAAVSGRWEKVAEFVDAYELAESRARYYSPVSLLAKRFAEQWAVTGEEEALRISRALLVCEIPAYLAIAAVAALAGRKIWKHLVDKGKEGCSGK